MDPDDKLIRVQAINRRKRSSKAVIHKNFELINVLIIMDLYSQNEAAIFSWEHIILLTATTTTFEL